MGFSSSPIDGSHLRGEEDEEEEEEEEKKRNRRRKRRRRGVAGRGGLGEIRTTPTFEEKRSSRRLAVLGACLTHTQAGGFPHRTAIARAPAELAGEVSGPVRRPSLQEGAPDFPTRG